MRSFTIFCNTSFNTCFKANIMSGVSKQKIAIRSNSWLKRIRKNVSLFTDGFLLVWTLVSLRSSVRQRHMRYSLQTTRLSHVNIFWTYNLIKLLFRIDYFIEWVNRLTNSFAHCSVWNMNVFCLIIILSVHSFNIYSIFVQVAVGWKKNPAPAGICTYPLNNN